MIVQDIKKVQSEKNSLLFLLLFSSVILQFLVIVYFNYSHAYGMLNMDTAMGIRQNIEQWRNGIFLEDFQFATALSNDYACFFVIPIYLLTGNLPLTMAAGQIMVYGIIVLILRDICKYLKATREQFLLSILVIFTPYSIDVLDWGYLLFLSVGYWSYRVIALLLLFDLLLSCQQSITKKFRWYVVLLISCFVLFWTSISTGNYILCMIVFPASIYVSWNIVEQQCFSLKSKEFWVIVASILVCILGWKYRELRLPDIGRDHNNLSLLTADRLFDNMENAMVGVLMLFGSAINVENISVFSTPGLLTLTRLAFLGIGTILVIAECIRKKGEAGLVRIFLCVFLVNFAVLLLTDTSYSEKIFESRYHLLWCIPFVLLIAYVAMKPNFKNNWINQIISYGFVLVLIVINCGGFWILKQYTDDKGYEKVILTIAEKNEAETIFVYGNPEIAYNLRAMDMDKQAIGVSFETGNLTINNWGYFKACADNAISDGPNVLICQDTQFDVLPTYIKSAYQVIDTESFGNGHNVYFAEYSPWDYLHGFPLRSEDRSIDFPYTKGYSYLGELDDKGRLIVNDNDQGIVLASPNGEVFPGTYSVTVLYEILEEGKSQDSVTLELVAHNGETVLLAGELPANMTKFSIEGIMVESEFQLQVRVSKELGSVVAIEKIIFERVNHKGDR